jgi:NAD+ synthetase
VSGGVDSALVVAIARPVCNNLGIKLIGRSLPATSNKIDEIKRADAVGTSFCTDFDVTPITDPAQSIYNNISVDYSIKEDEKFNKIALGNIKARVRMILLYDLAYRTRGMVLGTDNLTEYFLGFWSLHGDVGDYGMIQNLWKTEVYDLSKWVCDHELTASGGVYDFKGLALMSCVEAIPTDGLGITSSDLDQLGAPTYLDVDKTLKTWLTYDVDSFYWDEYLKYDGRIQDPEEFFKYRNSLKDHPVVQRHIKSGFKRNNPLNLKREQIF